MPKSVLALEEAHLSVPSPTHKCSAQHTNPSSPTFAGGNTPLSTLTHHQSPYHDGDRPAARASGAPDAVTVFVGPRRGSNDAGSPLAVAQKPRRSSGGSSTPPAILKAAMPLEPPQFASPLRANASIPASRPPLLLPGDDTPFERLVERSLSLLAALSPPAHLTAAGGLANLERPLFRDQSPSSRPTADSRDQHALRSSAPSTTPSDIGPISVIRQELQHHITNLGDRVFVLDGQRVALQEELSLAQRARAQTARELDEVRGSLDWLLQHRERKLERRRQRDLYRREKRHQRRLMGTPVTRPSRRSTLREESKAHHAGEVDGEGRTTPSYILTPNEKGLESGHHAFQLSPRQQQVNDNNPPSTLGRPSSSSTSGETSSFSDSSSPLPPSMLSDWGGPSSSRPKQHQRDPSPLPHRSIYRSSSQQQLRDVEHREEMLTDMIASHLGNLGPKWASRSPTLTRNVKKDLQDVLLSLQRARDELTRMTDTSLGVRSEKVLLTNEIRHANRIIAELIAEREALEISVRGLLNDKERSESIVEADLRRAQDAAALRDEEISQLAQEVNGTRQRCVDLEEEVRHLASRLQAAESVRDTWMQSAETSYDELLRMQNASSQLAASEQQIADLQDRLAAESAENQMLTSAAADLGTKFSHAAQQIERCDERIHAQEADIRRLREAAVESSDRYEGKIALLEAALVEKSIPTEPPTTHDMGCQSHVPVREIGVQVFSQPTVAHAGTSRTPVPSHNVSIQHHHSPSPFEVSRVPSSLPEVTLDEAAAAAWQDPYAPLPTPNELSISAIHGAPVLTGSAAGDVSPYRGYTQKPTGSTLLSDPVPYGSPGRPRADLLFTPSDDDHVYRFYFPDHPAASVATL